MNFKKIGVIVGREYAMRVKKKSFLLTTFLTPVLMALLMMVPSLIMFFGAKEKGQNVAVIDNSGIVMPFLASDKFVTFHDYTGENPDSLKSRLDDLDLKALVTISELDSTKSVAVQSYSYKPLGTDIESKVNDAVEEAVEDYRMNSYNVEGLRDMISAIQYSSSIAAFTIGEDGSENITVTGVYRVLAMIFSMLIYFFIFSFGGMVMTAVINEKTSRVVEVMVSSVKAVDLMIGKILGIAAVALTQFFLWIILTVALAFGVSRFLGIGAAGADPEAAAQMTGMVDSSGMMSDLKGVAASSEMSAVLETLSQIDFGFLITVFILFFIFGYLLYSSVFAALGSAVDNESDTQQLTIPVTVPILAAFFIAFSGFDNPESSLLAWASYIPFTSPICMITRVVNGIPSWEVWLSLAILIVTTFVMMYLSAKIYKVGILMFGKKSTFADLWKWLKYK